MKMFYILTLLLLIDGCNINYFKKEEQLNREELYVNFIVLEIEILTDFMKKHRKEDVSFDLIFFETSDEYYGTFGILTLETQTEVKMFFMYSMKYLYSIMRIMSNELNEDDYDWSWNMVLLDIKINLQAEKNRKSEIFKPRYNN